MTTRQYPFSGWVLQPSFKPKEVTIVSGPHSSYQQSESGKWYANSDVYSTKDEAIQGGWERVRKQQEDLNKKQVSLNKKQAVLRKAAE